MEWTNKLICKPFSSLVFCSTYSIRAPIFLSCLFPLSCHSVGRLPSSRVLSQNVSFRFLVVFFSFFLSSAGFLFVGRLFPQREALQNAETRFGSCQSSCITLRLGNCSLLVCEGNEQAGPCSFGIALVLHLSIQQPCCERASIVDVCHCEAFTCRRSIW